MKELWIK